jgi:hypothetical protein
MLPYWVENPRTKDEEKQKMMKYSSFMWTQEAILRLSAFWPKFGSDEDWICQVLTENVNDKCPKS